MLQYWASCSTQGDYRILVLVQCSSLTQGNYPSYKPGYNPNPNPFWEAPENNEHGDYVIFKKRDWLVPFGASHYRIIIIIVMAIIYVSFVAFVHVVEPNPRYYTDLWGRLCGRIF